jgi:hypothetical protein
MGDRGDLNSFSVKRSNSLTAGGANENGRGQVRGGQPGTPSTPRKCATRLSFWLTDLSPLHRNLLRTEQLSGTTSSQTILKSTFSVETQKICGVCSGLVED